MSKDFTILAWYQTNTTMKYALVLLAFLFVLSCTSGPDSGGCDISGKYTGFAVFQSNGDTTWLAKAEFRENGDALMSGVYYADWETEGCDKVIFTTPTFFHESIIESYDGTELKMDGGFFGGWYVRGWR